QMKETASLITSDRRKLFSARPASSSHATSGSLLHSSSSESTGRKLSSPAPSLRTTPSFPKPRTNPLRLPTHKQQDPPNNSFHLCTVGGVCSCCPPCSPPTKVRPGVNHALPETKVTEVTNGNPVCHFCPNPLKWSDCCGARAEFSRPTR